MASITILEKDLTTAASETSDNIIYVPGYAVRGPLNEPTLCTTLDSFQETFGSTPYMFKDDQYINGEIFIPAENYERGYIYAAEMLKAGAQVLFERVGVESKVGYGSLTIPIYAGRYEKTLSLINNSNTISKSYSDVSVSNGYVKFSDSDISVLKSSSINESSTKASFTVTLSDSSTKDVVIEGNSVIYTTTDLTSLFTTETYDASVTSGKLYYISSSKTSGSTTVTTYTQVEDDALADGTEYSALDTTLYVVATSGTGYEELADYSTLSTASDYYVESYAITESGSSISVYVQDKVTSLITDAGLEDTTYTISNFVFTYLADSSNKYVLVGEYSKQGTLTWRVECNGTKLSDDTVTLNTDENKLYFSYINCNAVDIDTLSSDYIYKYTDSTGSEVKSADLVIKSKYAGSYASTISVKVTDTFYSADEPYFKLTESYNGESNSVTISFNENSSYYYETMNSSLSFVEIESIKLDSFDTTFLKTALPIVDGVSSTLDYTSTASDEDEFTLEDLYNMMSGSLVDSDGETIESVFEVLADKGTYNVKYITSGGYPTYLTTSVGSITDNADIGYSIANEMMYIAAERADAIALIDHYDIAPKTLYNKVNSSEEGFNNNATNSLGENTRKYGSLFTPWGKYSMNTLSSNLSFPASFGYLKCMASSVQSNPNWYAVSGVTRGAVPNLLSLNQKMTGAIADLLQTRTGVSINPITTISPYGLCIWGNRTLMSNPDDLTASSFLNIRVLSCDLKKDIYTIARKLTWELNDDILWMNFKSAIEETLDEMVSGNGISSYKITKVATDKKATIKAIVRIVPLEAVEDWDFTIELADSYVSVE